MKSSPRQLLVETWVVNSSPVIALARVGQLELLTQIPQKALLPNAVRDELLKGPDGDPARSAIEGNVFEIAEVFDPLPEIQAWDLGAGETAVLTYARLSSGSVAVLDDQAARRCARSLSIPLIGTLSVVILARRNHFIDSAAKILRALQQNGFRLDDEVIRIALSQTVGEEW